MQGWRHVKVTARSTAKEGAHGRPEQGDGPVPTAALIRVVLDTLHRPMPAALYEAVPLVDARRLLRQLGFRDPPKPGSGLKRAVLEFAVGSKPGREQRRPTHERGHRTTTAGETQRHAVPATANGRLTMAKARRKLTGLYPSQPLC